MRQTDKAMIVKPMKAMLFFLLVFLWIPNALACENGTRFKAAAKCVALHKSCGAELSKCTLHCKPNLYVARQPLSCRDAACKYCSWPSSQLDQACSSWAIRHWCAAFFRSRRLHSPTPTPTPSPSPSPDIATQFSLARDDPYKCIWHGRGNHLVIDMKYIPPRGSWTRNGYGLEWKKDKPSGTDRPGSGQMCFSFRVPKSGNYYFTGITSAPHPTDHNDMWVKLSSGIRLYRGKTHAFRYTTKKYIKAYQNEGKDEVNNILSSVDHNPHYFVSENMPKNETHTVCISGRSSKFTVYKLVFVRCWLGNGSCNRWDTWIKRSVKYLIESICN